MRANFIGAPWRRTAPLLLKYRVRFEACDFQHVDVDPFAEQRESIRLRRSSARVLKFERAQRPLRRSGFTPRAVRKRVMILPPGAEIIRSAQLRRRRFTRRAVQKRVMILPLGAEIIRSAQLRRRRFTRRAVQKRVMILPLGAEIIRSAQLRRSNMPKQRLALELHAEVLARGLR
jgi:hypothetical protein